MILRLDPRFPMVWRTPTSVQLGIDPPLVILDPVTELVSLIKTQRTFEMNSQVIQAANETLQNVSNIRTF
jgi:hypothetical protein